MLIPHTTQLKDPTSTLDGLNCTCAIGATMVKWATRLTRPKIDPTAGDVRKIVIDEMTGEPDVLGGTSFTQVAKALDKGWDVHVDVFNGGSFGDAWEAAQDPEVFVGIAIQYSVLDGTKFDAGGSFLGAHATGFANAGDVYCDWSDPLADGRYGYPKGIQRMPFATLRSASAKLAIGKGRTAGYGRAWYCSVRTEQLPAPAPVEGSETMFNVGPIATFRDAIVKRGAVLYSDEAMKVRYSHAPADEDVGFGFAGSKGDAHIVINAGYTNYVKRADVLRIVANTRTFE